MEEVVGAGVLRERGGHGPQHAEVVGLAGDVREEVADPKAALPVLTEVPRRLEHLADAVELGLLDPPHHPVRLLAVVLFQQGFVIKAVHLGHGSFHEQEDHAAGLGGNMGAGQDTGRRAGRRSERARPIGSCHQGSQGQRAESVGGAAQEFPSTHADPGSPCR